MKDKIYKKVVLNADYPERFLTVLLGNDRGDRQEKYSYATILAVNYHAWGRNIGDKQCFDNKCFRKISQEEIMMELL